MENWKIESRSQERNKEVIVNLLEALLVKGLSLVISVFLMPAYLTFFHEQRILGIWYTILSVLNWALLFDLGLGNGLRNILPAALLSHDQRQAKEYISTTYFLMGGFSLVIAACGCIAIPFLNWNSIFNVSCTLLTNAELTECVQIVFIGIMIQLVLKMVTSILYAVQKSAAVNMLTLSSNILILISIQVLPSRSLAENLKTMSFINVFSANVPYLIATVSVFRTRLKGLHPAVRCFSKTCIKCIFNTGISLLWLQLVFMVICSANNIMISKFTGPAYVVQYQAYHKIFSTVGLIVSLALTPVWSAVTKAQAQNDYRWIKNIYKLFLAACLSCAAIELAISPFFGNIVKIWLGDGIIEVRPEYELVFVLFSSLMVLHNVNTSIGNGLSYFKLQMIWMTAAAIVCIPFCYFLVKIVHSWIGVPLGASLSILPYEILAPIYTFKLLKERERNETW